MNIGNYKNKLSQDLQYWNDVNKAMLPEEELFELIPPLTEEEKELLPVGIRNFYFYGRWFFNFISNVSIPYNRLLLLYSQRHISALFKSFMVYDEHEIDSASSGDTFDLLSSIPVDSAKELCRLLTGDDNEADVLLNCVMDSDRQGFHHSYFGLELSKTKLEAITKTINFLKSIAFSKAMEEIGDIEDIAAAKFAIKSHVSEISAEKEYDREITEFTLSVVDAFLSLVDNKMDQDLHEVIEEEYPYPIWVKLAKRFFSKSVYQMRRIWDDLTPEEQDIANEVLNPVSELTLIVNGERLRLSQNVIQLALRWSKMSRKKVVERDKSMNELSQRITTKCNAPSVAPDYSKYFVLDTPDAVTYEQMYKVAWQLAGKVFDGSSVKQVEAKYIDNEDVNRLVYFFFHKSENFKSIDFNTPIQWLGSWESFWYLVQKLYIRKQIPDNVKSECSENFRFKLKRNRRPEEGQISETTFNNYGKKRNKEKEDKIIASCEEQEFINKIIKEAKK